MAASPAANALLQAQRTVGNRAARNLLIQRDTIMDASGNLEAYEFEEGVDVTAAFVSLARRLARDGSISDQDLRDLREHAQNERETVSDKERILMAGLLHPDNVAVLNSTAAGDKFRFPAGKITDANREHVSELDRDLPASVRTAHLEASDAYLTGGLVGMVKQMDAVERLAAREIVAGAGLYQPLAEILVKFIGEHKIKAEETLTAMINAASDSSASDRVFAGIVYAIAKTANHAMATPLFNGEIKVDALSAAALASIPGFSGGEEAAYVTTAQGGGAKGDTMYVNTDLDPNNTFHRSVVIHELQHAADDDAAAASGPLTFGPKNQMEVNAYRSQARYLYDELAAQSGAARNVSGVEIAAGANPALVVALVIEGQTDVRRNKPLFEFLNKQNNPADQLSQAQIDTVFGQPTAALEAQLVRVIDAMYGLAPGAVGVRDGLGGESILDWIDRV